MVYKQVFLGEYFKFEKGLGYKGEFLVEDSDVALIGMDSHEEGGGYKAGSEKCYSGPFKAEHVAEVGDVIFAGTEQGFGLLASPLMVPESEKFTTYLFSGDVLKAIPLKPLEFSVEYLYNLYRVKDFRVKTAYGDTGTTVRRISNENFAEQLVPLPDLQTQQAINEIISLIDQQIANNQALSRSLEALIQTIFRSWFVDFDPVVAKSKGEKSLGVSDALESKLPSTFEDSEIGNIPRGWSVCELGTICQITIGGLWGAETKSENDPDDYYCVRGIEIEDLKQLGLTLRAPIRWAQRRNIEKRNLNNRHILIGGSGAGPVGKSLLWDDEMAKLFDKPVIFSNFVKRFECETEELATYSAYLLNAMQKSGEIMEYVNGTSVPNLQDKDLLKNKIVVLPSQETLIEFNNIVRQAYKIRFSGENQKLSNLLEKILYGLIYGEIPIPQELKVS